jgi:hypothetical protein
MTKNALFKAAALLCRWLPVTNARLGATRLARRGRVGPNRRQDWLVPTQDQITPSRAVLFRPPGKGPFRIAVIAHASTQNRLARAQMPQPDYRR